MTVYHMVDCKDEEIAGIEPWVSPQEELTGISIYLDSIKLSLTSGQIEDITEAWSRYRAEAESKLNKLVAKQRSLTDAKNYH
jgi:hypothetical protein